MGYGKLIRILVEAWGYIDIVLSILPSALEEKIWRADNYEQQNDEHYKSAAYWHVICHGDQYAFNEAYLSYAHELRNLLELLPMIDESLKNSAFSSRLKGFLDLKQYTEERIKEINDMKNDFLNT